MRGNFVEDECYQMRELWFIDFKSCSTMQYMEKGVPV